MSFHFIIKHITAENCTHTEQNTTYNIHIKGTTTVAKTMTIKNSLEGRAEEAQSELDSGL